MAVQCRSCGRKIIWAISPKGSRIPLDASPVTVYALEEQSGQMHARDVRHTVPAKLPLVEAGEATIQAQATAGLLNTFMAGLDSEDEASQKVYISHFVTCPDAKQWSGHGRGR